MVILLHSFAEVRAAIELSLGEVSGIGHGMGAIDGSSHSPSGRIERFWGFGVPIHPISLNGVFLYATSKFYKC